MIATKSLTFSVLSRMRAELSWRCGPCGYVSLWRIIVCLLFISAAGLSSG